MKRTLASLTAAGLLASALLTATASAATAGSHLPLENEPIVWGANTL